MLRNAFEVYLGATTCSATSRSTSASRSTTGAPAGEQLARATSILELRLRWWSDEKTEALAELDQAVALAPADADLRLKLAELRAQQQDPDEALTMLVAVEPLDLATHAQAGAGAAKAGCGWPSRPATSTRARQAAERLFGLRLDPQIQIQLAAQMHQLGMHELAEAKCVGPRAPAADRQQLVDAGHSLMRQYQAPGQDGRRRPDRASGSLQPAVRRRRRQPPGVRSYDTSGAKTGPMSEAIQVLARYRASA